MIPNVFISSTVKDLHYLRDAIRETVEDLSYVPVMSEYHEVGYINPTTAANSCYLTVRECQIVVVIIGRKYGEPTEEGISVTQKEYRTARDAGIPVITFVEKEVLNFKEVFDANVLSPNKVNFPLMDHPDKTFGFINEIRASSTYNGTIPFTNVGDAKRAFKAQVANLVGQKLTDSFGSVKGSVHEVLSELKTLRHELIKPNSLDESKRFLVTYKFLVEDRNKDYREIIGRTSGDLDEAIPQLFASKTFSEFLDRIHVRETPFEGDEAEFKALFEKVSGKGENTSSSARVIFSAMDRNKPPIARRIILPQKEIFLNSLEKEMCDEAHQRLLRRLDAAIQKSP